MKCEICRGEEHNQKIYKKYGRAICSRCAWQRIAGLPDPDCENCGGQGEYYWHSEDCHNDDCALAGGYGECEGRIIDCGCSLFDGVL